MLQKMRDWLENRELGQIKGTISPDELNERFVKALVSGKMRSAAYFLDLGASPDQNIVKTIFMSSDVVQHTPLTWAIDKKDEVLLKRLLDKGADVMKPMLYIPAAGPVRETLPLVMLVETKQYERVYDLAPHCTVDCLMEARKRLGKKPYQHEGHFLRLGLAEYLTNQTYIKQQQANRQSRMQQMPAAGAMSGQFSQTSIAEVPVVPTIGNGVDLCETSSTVKIFKKMQIRKPGKSCSK